ncbi:MAG TPA: zinc-binding dehydrogenase [Actinocatenispora sp.]
MLVVQATRFGGPDVLVAHEMPAPPVEAGTALIEVAAVDTLHVETRIRAGSATQWFDIHPPYVPGGAVAGTVRSVGDGVDPSLVGRRVAAFPAGAYAEQVVVPADELVDVPDALELTEAAALLHDGPTALGLADLAPAKPGHRVLVVGGTGGAGILLVQLAHAAGGYVVATARGEAKRDLVRRLGADEVVEPATATWASMRADTVVDGIGGALGTAAYAAVRDGGTFLAFGAPTADGFAALDTDDAARRGVTIRGIADLQYGPAERRTLVRRAFALAAEGAIVPVIGQTYPLREAAAAHAAIEARTVTAKTLLVC